MADIIILAINKTIEVIIDAIGTRRIGILLF